MKKFTFSKKIYSFLLMIVFLLSPFLSSIVQATSMPDTVTEAEQKAVKNLQPAPDKKKVTLRISNWEEYIDEGNWGQEELIDLDNQEIIGKNSLIEDFEAWYESLYDVDLSIEYSTFGTNEDLYNMLTLGDTFDLICPSEYMFMKLMSEGQLEPLSEQFLDEADEHNYYVRGVSPYIKGVFEDNSIHGESWSHYAAGYMWGVTGFVYNPAYITKEQASTWRLIDNPDFYRRITIKDNVRDSYFAAIGALNAEKLLAEDFLQDPDYAENLKAEMNDVSDEQIAAVQDYLQEVKDNVYSFETDSGKADMITGKVVANYQWSGDAVYAMDQAEEDDVYLNFSVPQEATNIYFDAWVMLKKGIAEDPAKKHAAEAFINFISRPDNAVRNMYYIGYTSVISGGADDTVIDYLRWNYESDAEDVVDYDLNYFFSTPDHYSDKYVIPVDREQLQRQLAAQYPDQDIMRRSSIMLYFPPERNAAINRMWVNVRCYNILHMTWLSMILSVLTIILFIYFIVKRILKQHRKKNSLFSVNVNGEK